MRIKRLDLKAFGPFTDVTLPFDSEKPGLHIIFGPNEAGKSSSLRALKALLYGFPERTSDNFIHANNQLLVGGFLENGDGRALVFHRRKKRKADIIDENGDPLEPNALAPFLHGLEPELFESLYGIDHETLMQGGEDILAQKGEVGQALFAAGSGISSLRSVIEQLEKESSDLFKPAGQNPEINRAVKKYKDLQKEVRAATLSSREWKAHQKALESAGDERARLEAERIDKEKELRRLERLQQAIPEMGILASLQEQLQAMGEVTLLPPDFSEQYEQVSREIREAGLQLEKDSGRLRQLEEKRKTISFNQPLLGQADRVDDFHQRLGEYRKGQKDKPERNGMRITLRNEAVSLLKQVRPDLSLDQAESLRPVLARKKTLQTLSSRYESIRQQLLQAEKKLKTADEESKRIEKKLAALPEPRDAGGLLQAVKLARKAGPVDEQLRKSTDEIAEGKKNCLSELARIGLWKGPLNELTALCLPLSETVKRFEADSSDIADQRRSLEKERKTAQKDLQNARAEIRKVAYAGEVPSEEELIQTREKRQQGWYLLRRQWLDQEDVAEESKAYAPGQPLPESYEQQVDMADRIADRLRREAERVAHAAALRAQVETLVEVLSECDAARDALDQRGKSLDQTWAEVWKPSGITPLSPKEMSGWLTEMDKLSYKAADVLKKEQEIRRIRERRDNLRQALCNALEQMAEAQSFDGEELGPVLVCSESVLERIAREKADLEKLKEQGENARKTLSRASDDLRAAEEARAGWRNDWHKAISGLGLAGEVSTIEALDILDNLQACFDKLKAAEDLQKRINGIDRDAAALEQEVQILVKEAAPELSGLSVEQAVLQLRTLLDQARNDRTLYDKLIEEIDQLRAEVSVNEKTLKSAHEQLDELLRIARCDKPADLAVAISRYNEYQKLQEKISEVKATIGKIGAGVPIEELARQAARVDADELPGMIASLKEEVDNRINPEINRLSQVVGEESNRLAAMDGSAGAAEAAERMEHELARIRSLAERYVRVKLASKILQQEIERYREAHQDPVLKIASGYFADLTLASFAGLRTDISDKGDPVLVGLRPDGTRVPVEGMSRGSRDQLYLALRLATLKWRLETSEPIPFIVDDILINFDDARSRATLQALADLSEKTQVILFTHHGRIVDQAEKLKTGTVQIHKL